MKVLHLPKGNGKFRTVYSPSRKQKKRLKEILPYLQAAERDAAEALGVEDIAHGFIIGRSPVSCALPHCNMGTTISCDLESWFDSVTVDQVKAGLKLAGADEALADKVCWKGAPRQGLPTSPSAANLAGVFLDEKIKKRLGENYIYTRYADDLLISFPGEDKLESELVLNVIRQCVEEMGWKLAEQKTEIHYSRGGRRVLVGISVDNDIRAPKKVRRKLRAAKFQATHYRHTNKFKAKAANSARGLAEWISMKYPGVRSRTKKIFRKIKI